MQDNKAPIGVFDSGYGGLTVLKEIQKVLPGYDYVYFGDNARAPYGTRSFNVVYNYTLEAVEKLFDLNCPLIILACNTASSKALRTIQQSDLPLLPDKIKRVLGVIRPCTEIIGDYTNTKRVGVLGTNGTINSNSYKIEIARFYPKIKVTQLACPLWVPLVEHNEYRTEQGKALIKQKVDELLCMDPDIDTIVLGCTHYPFLKDIIEFYAGPNITVIGQGEIVAKSLKDYLKRHTALNERLSRLGTTSFYTTEKPEVFEHKAASFLSTKIKAKKLIF